MQPTDNLTFGRRIVLKAMEINVCFYHPFMSQKLEDHERMEKLLSAEVEGVDNATKILGF
jgi:hypothetical protein